MQREAFSLLCRALSEVFTELSASHASALNKAKPSLVKLACENECTHFRNRGSREQSSFVRSRVKSRPGR